MTLIDLLRSAWAIQPDKLLEIQAIYNTHLRGEKIDLDALEARLGRPLANDQKEYEIADGGVAVLTIDGVIAPKANLFTRVSGSATIEALTEQLQGAAEDPRARSIVLAMDTPGGNVFRVPAFAALVHTLAQQKPIVVHSAGMLASAGYWIGAAGNGVYINDTMVQVGSIGVVATHTYNPRADTSVKTEITAGKYKRIASSDAPLSAEGQAVLQADVDYVYSEFVNDVARFRGVTSEQVLEHMADGRVFRGQQAIDAGLVDGVSTLDALVESMATDPAKHAKRRKAVFAVPAGKPSKGAGAAPEDKPTNREKGKAMSDGNQPLTRASFEQEHAALFAQVRSEFVTLGATQELQRVQAVLAVGDGLPGHEKLLNALAFDGKTTAADAAGKVLAAEKEARAAAAKAHADDAPLAAKGGAAPSDKPKTKTEQVAEAQALAKEKGIDFVAALKQLGYAS